METGLFQSVSGAPVTAVTAAEMRAVDRVAVEEFGLGVLQMMENAGRALAWHVRDAGSGPVTVLAGNGGNGGGGLCCARHLANRDVSVSVVLDRDPSDLHGVAREQYVILDSMAVDIDHGVEALASRNPETVVDALVGYGLDGPLRGTAARLVDEVEDGAATVVSLDVPSGVNGTTGARDGPAVEPDRLVTLALPKTGLETVDTPLFLADISIPAGVFDALDIPYSAPYDDEYWVGLSPSP